MVPIISHFAVRAVIMCVMLHLAIGYHTVIVVRGLVFISVVHVDWCCIHVS